MALRCFLFSSDEGTVANLRGILDGLGVEGEPCWDAVKAAEKITNQSFQIVIIDWDQQPEAGVLLSTARERKAAERPLTLAIVSNDASAPQALQAGANSLLRKPIVSNQARETLTTARDLLRAKQGSAANAPPAAPAAAAAAAPAPPAATNAATLRAGEFLQTPTLAPGGQVETEGVSGEPASHVSALRDLEPTAAAVTHEAIVPPPVEPPARDGLESRLRSRLAAAESDSSPPHSGGPRGNPDLATYDESSPYSANERPSPKITAKVAEPAPRPEPAAAREQRKEAELFAYIEGEREQHAETPRAAPSLKKRALIAALVLAGFAIVAAPEAPWHPKLAGLWQGSRQSLHAWLNPQPVTPAQAPVSHENFNRAGDEYKLPVAENIPDSTTDPSQIQVVPVVDPTARKPTTINAQPDPSAAQPEPTVSPADAPPQPSVVQAPAIQAPAIQAPANQAAQTPASQPNVVTAPPAVTTVASTVPVAPARPDNAATTTPSSAPLPAPPKYPQPRPPAMPGNVPSSLKSQMAATGPYPGGNKAPEAALPSIEPVSVTELSERGLLIDQPDPVYPPTAKGQQGTVVLQVLIGRDGSVQDAKFMQGSLVFARNAIDAVKQWKFKPYLMNGRAASVQTLLTIKFAPAQ
jgi:periplasmic protein TonB